MFRLVLEYDGTDFHGWQAQPSTRTVEGVLRSAIERVTSESARLTAAGRTDAGAHSQGQVVGLSLERAWQPERLAAAVNAVLPADLAVREAVPAPDSFHARFDAVERSYRYVVVPRRVRAPLLRRYAWQVPGPLDLDAMRRAASALRGTHDFAAFGRSPRPGGSTVRSVSRVELRRLSLLEDRVAAHIIEVSADAFLYGMMRAIAGVLVAVGRGRAGSDVVAGMLIDPRGEWTSTTVAPARGLHQWTVTYPVLAHSEADQEIHP